MPIELGTGEPRAIRLTRIHMEEDAAKNIHDDAVTGGGVTHVDLNRAGAPLVEIVSEPEIHSPEEAGAYLRSLRQMLRYLDVSDADMEKGQFRCDANVSVRRVGDAKLGTRTELKNLNSFRFVERAIASRDRAPGRADRVRRQGRCSRRCTGTTAPGSRRAMRTQGARGRLPLLPRPGPAAAAARRRLARAAARARCPSCRTRAARATARATGCPTYDAAVLTDDRDVSEFFEAAVALLRATQDGLELGHARRARARRPRRASRCASCRSRPSSSSSS